MEELSVRVTLGWAQVSVAEEGEIGGRVGRAIFCVTATVAVDVQPFTGLVAVSV